METKANNTQNLVEDITNNFIWLANAKKKAPKASIIESSKKLI